MKKTTRILLSIMAMSNISFAGGDFTEAVEPVVTVPVGTVDESGIYVGIGLSAVSTRESRLDFFDDTNGQDRTGDLTLLAGYQFSQYIAIEGRYMTSIAKEDILERSSWGIYAKPQYPVTEDFKVYALLGYGGFEASGINGNTIDVDDTGFQWGLGASYEVIEDIALFVDYVSITKDTSVSSFINNNVDINSDAVTVGVTYKF